MEVWLAWFHDDNRQAREVARAAERFGFAGVAVSDHVAFPAQRTSVHPTGNPFVHPRVPCPDPFTTIASMAAVTTSLRFMTYVYVLPMREPFSVARQVSSLAILTDHRFSFGVGVGWLEEEIALLGHDPRRRGPRADEMLEICQGFWREGVYEHHGEFYDFGPAGILPCPDRHVPVWVGGRSEAALRRAARHDGWLGMNYPLEDVGPLLRRIDDERARRRDAGLDVPEAFRRFTMPTEAPTPEVYGRLEALGIDATVAMAWRIGHPDDAPLQAKLDAMARFAERFGLTRGA